MSCAPARARVAFAHTNACDSCMAKQRKVRTRAVRRADRRVVVHVAPAARGGPPRVHQPARRRPRPLHRRGPGPAPRDAPAAAAAAARAPPPTLARVLRRALPPNTPAPPQAPEASATACAPSLTALPRGQQVARGHRAGSRAGACLGSSHRHTLRQAAQVSPRRPPPAQGQERSNTWHPARRWATSGFGSGFGRPQAYQHVYMFALYGLLAMKSVFLDDFFTLAGGAIGPVRVPRSSARPPRPAAARPPAWPRCG